MEKTHWCKSSSCSCVFDSVGNPFMEQINICPLVYTFVPVKISFDSWNILNFFSKKVKWGNTSNAFIGKLVGLSNSRLSTSSFEVDSLSENFLCVVFYATVYTFCIHRLWYHYFTIHAKVWVICCLLTVFILGFGFGKSVCNDYLFFIYLFFIFWKTTKSSVGTLPWEEFLRFMWITKY